jgi:hypothetical protein
MRAKINHHFIELITIRRELVLFLPQDIGDEKENPPMNSRWGIIRLLLVFNHYKGKILFDSTNRSPLLSGLRGVGVVLPGQRAILRRMRTITARCGKCILPSYGHPSLPKVDGNFMKSILDSIIKVQHVGVANCLYN